MEKQTFEIVTTRSNIDWVGRKITGAHNGTIGISSGTLDFSGNQLTGGAFTVDTTSIKILDVTDPATNAQFAGHLASDDFFASEEYPEARLVITHVVPAAEGRYSLTGNLTIKDVTHPVHFIAVVKLNNDHTLTAAGKIMVDRTLYGMKFRSGNFFQNLGDTLIYNEFELDIHITAKAVAAPVAA